MTTLADILLSISRVIGDGVSGSAAIPTSLMIKSVNQALDSMTIPYWDETTAVTDSTIKYALPSGVSNVLSVEIGNTTDGWEPHYYWKEQDGYIHFYKDEPTDTDDYLRLGYQKKPITVNATSDAISDFIPVSRLIEEAVVNCLTWRLAQVGTDEPRTADLLKFHQGQLLIERNRNPMNASKSMRYATW